MNIVYMSFITDLFGKDSPYLKGLVIITGIITVIIFVNNLHSYSNNVREGLTDRQLDAKRKGLDSEEMLNNLVSAIQQEKDKSLYDDYSEYYKEMLIASRDLAAQKVLSNIEDEEALKKNAKHIRYVNVVLEALNQTE